MRFTADGVFLVSRVAQSAKDKPVYLTAKQLRHDAPVQFVFDGNFPKAGASVQPGDYLSLEMVVDYSVFSGTSQASGKQFTSHNFNVVNVTAFDLVDVDVVPRK